MGMFLRIGVGVNDKAGSHTDFILCGVYSSVRHISNSIIMIKNLLYAIYDTDMQLATDLLKNLSLQL